MSYKVIDTQQTTQIVRSGRSKEVFRVWIQTGKGASGSVDVDPDDWNAEALTRILTQKAEQLDLAYNLPVE